MNIMNNKYLKLLIKCVDLIIIVLVISFLIYDFFSLIENLFKLSLNNEYVNYMVDNSKNVNSHTTTVQVIHDDGSWSNGIRSLFIYGTGALRISLLKGGGTPAAKGFIIATTVGTDAVTKIISNIINDPNYILSHVQSWKTIWDGKSETAHVYVEGDKETSKIVDSIANSSSSSSNSVSNVESSTSISNNFISDGNGLDALYNKIVAYIMNILGPILEPVKVSYSNELLANQLYNISIMLFILSILIIIMLIGFTVNFLIYINSERVINYFTNKYIKWYVNFNKKIIGIELFFIGSTIFYSMYILSYGLHFLATHPITFN